MSHRLFAILISLIVPLSCAAQQFRNDVADRAISAAFGRDNRVLLCLQQGATHSAIRAQLDPLIAGVDPSREESFRPILTVIYANFPCPFSPYRSELARATRGEIVGRWIYPQSSMTLRHGPNSPAWRQLPVPLKCESVLFEEDGTYRVMQVAGASVCPDSGNEVAMMFADKPRVQTWALVGNDERIRIDRTDVPAQFEEWEAFVVRAEFSVGQVKFNVGDILQYQRKDSRNEIGAATVFRHLQRLK